MSDRTIWSRIESGLWVRPHPGVYQLAAVPLTWRSRVLAGCLAAGTSAVASHRSAATLWSLDGSREGFVEVTQDRGGQRRLHGVALHRTRSLPLADRSQIDAIPVTRPARTLIDLAAVLAADPLEQALDSALREGLVTVAYLDRRLGELESRGRDGIAVLRELLDDRRDGKPADSQAENRLLRALLAAGLPPPVRQFRLYDGGGLAATFDLAYPPPFRIGIEFDSYRHHYGRQAWRHDQVRHNRATALGWLVFHLTADADVTPVVHAYRGRTAA